MNKCPNGHEISDNMKFCPICGAEIKEKMKIVCKNCGYEQIDIEKFCPQCGTPFDDNTLIPNAKKYSKFKISIIVSLFTLVAVVVGYLLWFSNGDKYSKYSLEGLSKVTYQYDWVGDFNEGLAPVGKDTKIGFIDRMGNEVIPCIFEGVESGEGYYKFSDGLALVYNGEKDYYIDKQGKEAFPFKYSYGSSFSEGLAVVYKGEKYGYIDKHGNEVIPCIFEYAYLFSEGLAPVYKDGKYGFIDTKGNVVIPYEFDYEIGEFFEPSGFNEGLAAVCKDGKYGYIDIKGNVVIPFKYDYASDFSESMALVGYNNNLSFINKEGREVVPCPYTNVSSNYESVRVLKGGYFLVNNGINYGYVGIDGKEITPCIYESANVFSDGLAVVQKDGVWGYVDTKGNSTFDVMSEETKAQVKEKQRMVQQKREEEQRRIEEEQRRIEEENKPQNRFYNIAQTEDYVWKCFEYQSFDFHMNSMTDEVLLYFKPENKGGGTAFYVSHKQGENNSWYMGYSGNGPYTVSDNFMTMTIRSIYRSSSGPRWEDIIMNFVIENDGDKVKLIRIFNPPRSVRNTDYKYISIDRVNYIQIRKPMDNPFNQYTQY